MQTLYELIREFWLFWFPADLAKEMLMANDWICYVITVVILVSVFIAPWFIFAGGRRRHK